MSSGDQEPGGCANRPGINLKVADADQFPTLVNSEGWEVVGSRQLEHNAESLGSAWCDRAKVAASLPAPRATQPKANVMTCRPDIVHSGASVKPDVEEQGSEYEMR